ncbi:MAG: hypothetical protein LBG97_07380, partial [Coriobacteriales bacterium]|nr:hypothetical protein [Coriobacteriales bacterium]
MKDPLNPTIAVADANPNIVLALEEENFQDIDADAVVVTIKRANNDFIVVCVKDFVQDAVNLNVWSYTSDSLPDGIYDIVVNTQLTDAAGNVLDVPVDALAPVPMNFKVCALPEIQTELTFSQSINALELIKTEQDVQNPAIKSVDNVTLIYCGEEKSIIEGISVNASDYLILSSTDSNSANILAYRATENIFLGAGAASDVTFSIKIQIGYRNNDEGILRYKTASVLTHKAILTLAPQVLPFGSNLQLIPNSDEFLDDQLQFIYNAQECVLAKPNLNGLALNVKGLFNTSIANSVLVFDKYVNPQTGIYPGYTNFYLLKWGSATLTSAASNNIVLANDDVLLGNYFSFYKERLLRTHEMVYSLIDDVDANGQSTQVMVAAVYDSATATTWVRSKDVMLKHNGYDFWPEPEDLSGFSASVQKYDGSPISFTETSNYYAKLQVSAAHPENEKYVFPVGAISYDGSEPQVVDVVFQEPVVKKDGWIAYMDETTIKVRLADGGIAIASADATGNAGDASGSGSTGSASSSGSTGNSGTTGDASDAADSATDANATDNSSQESVSGISQATLYYQGAKLDTQVANSSDEEIVTLSFKLGPSDTAYLMQDFTISASDRAGNELSSYSLDAYLRSNDGTVDSDLQGGLQGDLQDGSQVASAAIASTSNVSSKTNNDANTLDGVEAIIVDAVSPVVSVNFNNNLAQNEKYYNAARIATISVNEAHFAQAIELNPSSAIASYSIDNKEPIKLLARAFNRSSDDPNVWQA